MKKPASPWRVELIVEQDLLRQLLTRAILEFGEAFNLIASVGTAEEAREVCLRLRPHLVVLDLDLAAVDAIEFAHSLMRSETGTHLLTLSSNTDPVSLNRIDEIGVPGFIDKNQSLEILEEAMHEVAAGHRYRTTVLTANQGRLRADPHAFPRMLTGREQDILRLVIRGCTSRAIAQRLKLSHRSVETFRYRLMQKLGVRNVAGLMDFAFRNGLMTPNPAPSVGRTLVNPAPSSPR